jgi:pimeloyl-ACP methyl ester carboxylesterase
MPYSDNAGIRIHYQVEGQGSPLVLYHGFGTAGWMWYAFGYVEPLSADHQLILIDARGHGASDKPHDPEAYMLPLQVGDVIAVLDDLGIEQAHYMGYSMGGHVGWGIATYAPERISSLIVSAAGFPETDPGPDHPETVSSVQQLKEGMEAWVGVLEKGLGQTLPAEPRARLLDNDAEALIAFLERPRGDACEPMLSGMDIPCLVMAGEDDSVYGPPAKRASEIVRNAAFVSLPGLDHVATGYRVDLVLPHIHRFLAEVEQI